MVEGAWCTTNFLLQGLVTMGISRIPPEVLDKEQSATAEAPV